MSRNGQEPACFVRTIKQRCRVCYTCVRECPAKAIRLFEGQAEVLPERCIGCGNCVRVCSQGAKQAVTTVDKVRELLTSGDRVAACLAPSFPAEFQRELDFRVLVGMVKALGFDLVTEVAFGADLVAERYRQLAVQRNGDRYIATTCPSVVGFVKRYHPELVGNLAPLVSPMVAMARALRHLEGHDLKVVFIGPCISKKSETIADVPDSVDAAITFAELRSMLLEKGIGPDNSVPSDFDPPHPALGALFPLSRGILQAAGIQEDLMSSDVVAAGDGVSSFAQALSETASGSLEAGLLEVLCCKGCIAGPGITSTEPHYRRRMRVSHFVSYRMASLDRDLWHRNVDRLAGLDLSRTFCVDDQRMVPPSEGEMQTILVRMGKERLEDELNCGACGYATCREHAMAIYKGLAESEMCLPFVIDKFKRTIQDLYESHRQLANTQEQLMHSEKLASMGQLAAGVAHELNNPLGVVLMYSHLLLDEMATDSGVRTDLQRIAEQADRCKRIVANLLDFARENKVLLQAVDVSDVVERAVASVPAPEGIEARVIFRHRDPVCEMDADQMLQVITNLVSNAFAAMPNGGTVTIETAEEGDRLVIRVSDTGCGIPPENLPKIFQPFFTTKKIGKGTGLGLAVSYGIVKMHRGDIRVESNANAALGPTGTTFTVSIPKRGVAA